jgi:hypothetical protein
MKLGHKEENEHLKRNRTSLRQDVSRILPAQNLKNRRIESRQKRTHFRIGTNIPRTDLNPKTNGHRTREKGIQLQTAKSFFRDEESVYEDNRMGEQKVKTINIANKSNNDNIIWYVNNYN